MGIVVYDSVLIKRPEGAPKSFHQYVMTWLRDYFYHKQDKHPVCF